MRRYGAILLLVLLLGAAFCGCAAPVEAGDSAEADTLAAVLTQMLSAPDETLLALSEAALGPDTDAEKEALRAHLQTVYAPYFSAGGLTAFLDSNDGYLESRYRGPYLLGLKAPTLTLAGVRLTAGSAGAYHFAATVDNNGSQAQAIGTVSFSADGLIEQLAIEEDDAILMWLLGL